MTSGKACHHHLWAAQSVELRRAWNEITALGLHRRSDDVGCDMTSSPLDSTHDRTTSGVACHHRLWVAHTIKQRQAWNDITTFGQYIRSNDVGRERPSPPLDDTLGQMTSGVACRHLLGQYTRSNDVGLGMPSSPLGSTNIRKMSVVACHHRPWTARTVGLRQAWHSIIAFEQHTRSNDVGRGIQSSPLGSTKGRMTSAVA